ncbi:cytochrome o ubiquinol oxidase subunit IV [Lichenihabitans psoromatis]|uniref:cytochrome o ubiquinol oxidase subunit IV n=1 Tax=Lichenihabitans psoromatis TaxID=2528642 RepID=UPI00103847AF
MSPHHGSSSRPTRKGRWGITFGVLLVGLLGLLPRKRHATAAVAVGSVDVARSDIAKPSATSDAGSRNPDRGRTHHRDAAPGEHHPEEGDLKSGVRSYVIGLGLAALLTAGSFYISSSTLVYGPAVFVALIVFAIAQIGIHLVFFFHLTTSPDNINNAMALAFGVLIIGLLIGGSLWIMGHMNHNMMPMGGMTQTQP